MFFLQQCFAKRINFTYHIYIPIATMLSLRPIEHCDGAVMELRRCIEFDVNAMFYKLAISFSMCAILNGRLYYSECHASTNLLDITMAIYWRL